MTEAPITREVVYDARLLPGVVTDRVEVRRITMAPDTPAGLHVHNGPVLGCVLAGSVVYQIEGGEEQVLTPGDVFYEPADTRIARFDAQADGVTFLGYFLLDGDKEATLTLLEE